ncbi:unnamed protein product [Brugia timori]|uniref:IBB domain-containing protein n=1 Tax=Brugia timori TaxID=42155 RepID=A0A0R3Q3A4_9BILA|nr:unnamed protein product [Brugia timori]
MENKQRDCSSVTFDKRQSDNFRKHFLLKKQEQKEREIRRRARRGDSSIGRADKIVFNGECFLLFVPVNLTSCDEHIQRHSL